MSLSPEWKLVLSCARGTLLRSDGRAPVQGLPDEPIGWERVAAIACQNRVAPLVYPALRRRPLPSDAQPALEVLNRVYVATAARNAVLFGALRTVLEALSAARVAVIVLKGAALAETVYPERALRPMADIDLLIRKENLEEAERQLRSVGYEVAHDPETREELRSRHHHWVFQSARPDAGGIPIELHWSLDPPGGPVAWDVEALFERATPISRAGAGALVLCPEDLLLHLCLHLCRHRFNGGVIALCDIAAAVARYEGPLDWAKVQALAVKCGASEYLFVPLQLAAELMGADVPPSTLAGLRGSDGDDRMLELARERILEEKGDVRAAAELRLRWRRRRVGGRLAAVQRAFLPETATNRHRDRPRGRGSRPRYLAHLAGLFCRYGPWLWALARHPRLVWAVVEREEGKPGLDAWCSASEPPGDPH